MRAITFRGIRELALEELPDPRILQPEDAIVAVELAAICGSDLHPYRGHEQGLERGTVLGHEFLGRVVAIGSGVRSLTLGTRVVAPFSTSCGSCRFCRAGLSARCTRGELFGWRESGRGLHGAQAELVRVPLADTTLLPVPATADPVEALFSGDILSTGTYVAELGGVEPESTVAVIGAGPVGLMACIAAREAGAARVYALDSIEERLDLARRFGAIPLDYRRPTTRTRIEDETDGAGVDCALECVGSPGATRLALDLLRPGGTLAAAGVHTEAHLAFSPGEAYDKNLTYRAGRCPARRLMDQTLALVAGRSLGLGAIVSHRVGLEGVIDAYRLFDERREGCTKVLIDPRS